MNNIFNKFSVAPMLGYTDRHCRYFYSLFTKYIKLYTEMIHTSEFLYKYKNKILFSNNIKECIVAIQFVGNNFKELYLSSKIAKKMNFNEINFNIGCPSLKAKYGNFGFFLYKNISCIIDCLNSIKEGAENINISIKLRINVLYSYNELLDFILKIYNYTSCKIFIIHARSILINNYSTKLNLLKPILNYNMVYKLKKDLPFLNIVINGNINSIKDINTHLKFVDGIMMGRYIYKNPLMLFDIDEYFSSKKNKNFNINSFFFIKKKINFKIKKILFYMYKYILYELNKNNIHPKYIIRHMINICYKINNGNIFRRRFLKSANIFNFFNNYKDFQDFIFKI